MRMRIVSKSASRERSFSPAPSYTPMPPPERNRRLCPSAQTVLASSGPSVPKACVMVKEPGSVPRISKTVRRLIASRHPPKLSSAINESPSHVGWLITPPPSSGVSSTEEKSNGSYGRE